jgi:hypothetical protein
LADVKHSTILLATLLLSVAMSAQDVKCHGSVEHQTCEFSNGDVIESSIDSAGNFSQHSYNKGNPMDLGEKSTWDRIIEREDEGETKARHELCIAGIIKGYRCHDVPKMPITEEKPVNDFHDCLMFAGLSFKPGDKSIERCDSDADYRKTMAEKWRGD